jgi:ATP-dependent DNA helicase RecG
LNFKESAWTLELGKSYMHNPLTPIEIKAWPNRGELLRKELGIHKYKDLINLYPNRYIDRTRYYKINELQNNVAEVQIIGKIINIKTVEFAKAETPSHFV